MPRKISPLLKKGNQWELVPKTIAEGLGTFAIVFFGCGAIRLGLSPLIVSIVFGLTVALMIYTLGHLSGAHFNPAVTLGFAAAKRFPRRHIVPYWLSQLTGAFLGVGLLSLLLPGKPSFGAVTSHLRPWQILCWEALLTFCLMLVIITVATHPKSPKALIASSIGGMVLAGSMVGGPFTGAAMNPARFLAPAFAEGKWGWWWIYLFAAFLGALLAAMVHEKIQLKD